MKKSIVGYLWVLVLVLGSAAAAAGAVNAAKMELLQQRITAVQVLLERIGDIHKQAVTLQGTLQARAAEYSREIHDEKIDRKLKTFQQAVGVYRVRYNLKLVQQVNAYLGAVSERIEFFQQGREQIDFLYQQAQDDLKMVRTLSDMEIAVFIDRMDRTLAKYTRAADSSLFAIEKIRQEKLEAIWKAVSASK